MKHNKKHKSDGKSHILQQVHVEFSRPTAIAVAIAGTFNDWRPEITPMVSLGDGRWAKDLMLTPGMYEYRLVVDGDWMPDPKANEAAPNPFGEMNSVLRVRECVK